MNESDGSSIVLGVVLIACVLALFFIAVKKILASGNDKPEQAEKPEFLSVEYEFMSLSPEERDWFNFMFNQRRKKTFPAYIFLFCLGTHYLYLQQYLRFIVYQITLGGFLLWALLDFCSMPLRVKEVNNQISLKIIQEIKAKRSMVTT